MLRAFSEYEMEILKYKACVIEEKKLKDAYWFENVMTIIKRFAVRNQRIIYGGFAILLNIQRKDRNVVLPLNDIDMFSPAPIDDLHRLVKIIAKNDYCYKTRTALARHSNTYTLFVNDRKVLDISYLDPTKTDSYGYYKAPFYNSEIFFVRTYISYIDYFSILSDVSSVWLIEKTITKINQLQNYYPFRNPTGNKTINELCNPKFNSEQFAKSYIEYISTYNPVMEKIQNFQYQKSINRFNLISTFTFRERNPGYFVSGLYAYNEYIKLCDQNIEKYLLKQLLQLDIYVYKIDYYITIAEELLTKQSIEFYKKDEDGWANHSENVVSFYTKNHARILSLHNISTTRSFIKSHESKFNISSFYFLLSFLLMQSNVKDRKNADLYNKAVFHLLNTKDDYIRKTKNNEMFDSLTGDTIGVSVDVKNSNNLYNETLKSESKDKDNQLKARASMQTNINIHVNRDSEIKKQ